MGCAPQSRAPAPPEVSGPLGPAAKPNPRACPSLDEPLPECASPELAHSHCDSRKPPARTGASCRPRAAWRKPPAQTRASRRPRAAWRKPPAKTGAGCGQPPDAKLRLTPRRENREATYRPPPSSAHPRLRRRRRSFRAIRSAAARSWRTSDEAERAQAPASPVKASASPVKAPASPVKPSARTASRGRRRANSSESGCPRRRCRAASIYGTKPSRLWFSAKCRQITPTAHPLSGPIRSELGPKVTGFPGLDVIVIPQGLFHGIRPKTGDSPGRAQPIGRGRSGRTQRNGGSPATQPRMLSDEPHTSGRALRRKAQAVRRAIRRPKNFHTHTN